MPPKRYSNGNFKETLLENLKSVSGIYIPSFYSVFYFSDGRVREIVPKKGAAKQVRRRAVATLKEVPHSPVVTSGSVFRNMFLVELSRGCPYRCRFCLAKFLTCKFRTAPEDEIKAVVARGLDYCRRVGFVGTGFSSSDALNEICDFILGEGGEISFSSLRLTPQVREVFVRYGSRICMNTITVAPEVAAPHLYKIINKHPVEFDQKAIKEFLEIGVKKIKMYFLIGVPGEKDEDVEAIADFAGQFRQGKEKFSVVLSVNPLIPKPFTPLQWWGMERKETVRERAEILKRAVRKTSGVVVKIESLRMAELQAVLSRGDRLVGKAILKTVQKGATASEFFREMKTSGLAPEFYVHRERDAKEIMPWDVLEYPYSKQELCEEYAKVREAIGK